MAMARSRARVRYILDDEHRLVLRERRDPAARLRPVRVLDGTASIDRRNRFVYRVDSSAGPDGRTAPHRIHLDGAWSLTPDHDLLLTLHETDRQERQTLYLNTTLLRAEANALVVALRRNTRDDRQAAQELTLSGRWQADARNRLTFLAEKADGSEDRLTLQGGWEVGPHHELVYRYRRRSVSGPGREAQVLIFNGSWDITSADRLVYRLAGSSDSTFEFKASLQSPSLLASDGRLIYQIGIGLSAGKALQRRVALFGTWKLNRDLSVSFEVPYADGRVGSMRFEGSASLSRRDRISVALRAGRREPLGVTVTFTRELVPDASLFLRLRRDEEDRSVIGGVQVRF